MQPDDARRAALQARLDAGEWLPADDIATLLATTTPAVNSWIRERRIAKNEAGGYDPAGVRAIPTADSVEQRLNAGEWLGLLDLAILFGVDKATVARWVRLGHMHYRLARGFGRYERRLCSPTDVRTNLDELRRERRDGPAADG